MKYVTFSSLFFLFLLIITSCQEANNKNLDTQTIVRESKATDARGIIQGKALSKYVGQPGRLIVVAENTVFTDEISRLLDSVYSQPVRPYYPFFPKFEIHHITPEQFNKGNNRLRNLMFLFLTNEPVDSALQIRVKKDYYAQHQLIVEYRAHTMNELFSLLSSSADEMLQRFDEIEWKREYYRHKADNNTVLKNQLAKQFGITLELPKHGTFESNRKNFARIAFPDRSRPMDLTTEGSQGKSKVNFIQSGIMIWQIPFKDSSQLTPEYLMRARDTILKYNALHEFPGVYMGTQDHPAVLPVSKRIKIGAVEGYEFRGLYKFTGRLEPSGGKFWSFHFLHPKRQQIMAVSGYLDAPPTMSPAFDLRRIQAVIYSLKLVERK